MMGAVALSGCTALNGSFEPGGETEFGSTTAASDSTDPTSGKPTGGGSASGGMTTGQPGSTSAHTTTGHDDGPGSATEVDPTDSGVGETSTTAEDTGISETGVAETGVDPAWPQVVFVYSEPGWTGNSGGKNAFEAARERCTVSDTYAGDESLCTPDHPPVPVLRASELPVSFGGVAGTLEWTDVPLFGIGSDGSDGMMLASNLADLLLNDLPLSLAEAGVDTHDSERFWSGGLELEPENCADWTTPSAVDLDGRVGRFDAQSNWFHSGQARPCLDEYPILCACLSVEYPFE